ncbi:hypothetical protein G7A66_00605 [Altererythrobacter sp. SALINAS58]|uniref:hypothetical protein n=1 Tax=Alteripontixanthobacter muriae TaxID=2705546 RepID=UPI0015777332|nr:hypothetical protein [Alteripontixanthobacter muriae]NTZ41613.1 hypothetical protein [Alteripontixanthobacter muriae]
MLRIILQIAGFALVLTGLLWVFQGLGLLMWPEDSFMLGQSNWAGNGAIAVFVGLLLLLLARRRLRD